MFKEKMARMVKKAICLLALMFMIVLCACNKDAFHQSTERNNTTIVIVSNITMVDTSESTGNEVESYSDMTFASDFIVDEITAKKIADSYLVNSLGETRSDFQIVETHLSEIKGVWFVIYLIDEYTCGGDICIEISQEGGEVVSVTYGE